MEEAEAERKAFLDKAWAQHHARKGEARGEVFIPEWQKKLNGVSEEHTVAQAAAQARRAAAAVTAALNMTRARRRAALTGDQVLPAEFPWKTSWDSKGFVEFHTIFDWKIDATGEGDNPASRVGSLVAQLESLTSLPDYPLPLGLRF